MATLVYLSRSLLSTHLGRFCRFGAVGVSGVLVNMAILYGLVAHFGWPHLAAAAVSSEAAILSNFVLNDIWTFRDATSRLRWGERLLRYNAVALGGVGISLAVLEVLTVLCGVNYLLANLAGIVVSTLWNYGANALYTWNAGSAVTVTPLAELATTKEG